MIKRLSNCGLLVVALLFLALAFCGGEKTSSQNPPGTSPGIGELAPPDIPMGGGGGGGNTATGAGGAGCSPSGEGSSALSKLSPRGWSPIFWIILAIWVLTQIIPGKWDDYILYGGSIGMLLLSWVGKGCLGDWSPFSAFWWLLECTWIILGVWAVKKFMKERPILKWTLIALGWFILGVLS